MVICKRKIGYNNHLVIVINLTRPDVITKSFPPYCVTTENLHIYKYHNEIPLSEYSKLKHTFAQILPV